MSKGNDYEKRFLAQHNPSISPVKPINSTRSPQTTPTKNRPAGVGGAGGGDRFIPIRLPAGDWAARFAAIPAAPSAAAAVDAQNAAPSTSSATFPNNTVVAAPPSSRRSGNSAARATAAGGGGGATTGAHDEAHRQESVAHRALLRNELLRARIDDIRTELEAPSSSKSAGSALGASRGWQSAPAKQPPLFTYQTQRTPTKAGGDPSSAPCTPRAVANLFGLSPLTDDSLSLLRSPRQPVRRVPRMPFKVLDAPELADDFYLNLVDWSNQNTLSVGLGTCVYLWSAHNSQVTKLCDLSAESDSVTSVQWTERGDQLAVGTQKGLLQVWDVATGARTLNLAGHTGRVGCLAWNADLVCSGSRDRLILARDVRVNNDPLAAPRRVLAAHRQEVCGLKWSPDRSHLASGGNDNQLLVWSARASTPVQAYTEHGAAVKALAWSPHHHGLLVSGGGTADRTLRFWNTLTGQSMQSLDTGSQVCNVAWSKHSNELVTTHGYSQNQIVIWRYPSLQQVAKLTGHTYRVLYLAMSPDGESIVTGAGDETLRFWHVFNKQNPAKEIRSKLNLFTSIR